MPWPAEEARRSFSDLLRRAHDDGAQVVTRHGREVAVVIDIEEYRRLKRRTRPFTEHLLTIPSVDDAWADEFAAEVRERRSSGRRRESVE
jgi:prevent-host-death family protein